MKTGLDPDPDLAKTLDPNAALLDDLVAEFCFNIIFPRIPVCTYLAICSCKTIEKRQHHEKVIVVGAL
jgi:hypothetical protein